MKIILHLDIGKDDSLPYQFETYPQLLDFIISINHSKPTVWVFGSSMTEDATDEIIITEKIGTIIRLIERTKFGDMDDTRDMIYYLQEYESYQSAYAVTLSIREANPLCYDS